MKRRDFLKSTAAAAGASVLPLETLAQSDRRKELLVVANETGPNSQDIHTVGANRPAYGVSWLAYDRLMTFGRKTLPNGAVTYDYTKLEPELAATCAELIDLAARIARKEARPQRPREPRPPRKREPRA